MEKKNDLCERLLRFAVDVILYLHTVKNTLETVDTKRQLIKASTSSGANYEESVAAESRADFIHKTQIVLKEVRESNYWLRLIKKANFVPKDDHDLKFLLPENFELIKIFSKSLVTAKQNKK